MSSRHTIPSVTDQYQWLVHKYENILLLHFATQKRLQIRTVLLPPQNCPFTTPWGRSSFVSLCAVYTFLLTPASHVHLCWEKTQVCNIEPSVYHAAVFSIVDPSFGSKIGRLGTIIAQVITGVVCIWKRDHKLSFLLPSLFIHITIILLNLATAIHFALNHIRHTASVCYSQLISNSYLVS